MILTRPMRPFSHSNNKICFHSPFHKSHRTLTIYEEYIINIASIGTYVDVIVREAAFNLPILPSGSIPGGLFAVHANFGCMSDFTVVECAKFLLRLSFRISRVNTIMLNINMYKTHSRRNVGADWVWLCSIK